MGEIHGGHVVARYLKEVEGTGTIFALSGGHIMPILDGCLEYGIRVIDVRHEQAAAMMAHAWSIYRGRPGVCLVTAGPGFTNTLTGVANAYHEGAPMVVLSGVGSLRELDKGALQDVNQVDMIKPVTKWTGKCHDVARIPEYMEAAFSHAISGRPGPVYLELPPDILIPPLGEDGISYPTTRSTRLAAISEEGLLAKAAELLNNAEKPLLIGGDGICWSDADAELQELVEKAGIPTLLLNNARGTIPDEHPLSLWRGGFTGLIAALSMADVVLAVGIRFNWLLNYGDYVANAKVIRVDIDPVEVNRNRAADVALVGDAGAVLRQLNPKVDGKDRGGWLDTLGGIQATLSEGDRRQMETPSDPVHPFRLMHQLRQAAGDDAIYVIDGGDTVYFGLIALRASVKAGVIANGLQFGSLGIGMPFAMAARLARPDTKVILVSGDGSFGFNAMEFETASRHCIPVVSVICNDQAWGSAKHSQELCYAMDRVCGTELGVVHYERLVEALGGHGEFVTRDGEIIPAIERALESGKPACVNVLTDPEVTSPSTLIYAESLKSW
ncbi:MAG: thiamine pyrophosphate-binding protein [Actinobacteria bacterium]|jgi:acetolactate synthase-1/2/3 large subunit|nr:MAG: thiamine pyrophosphate-binding protein [Actinomycetota bacterium]